MLLTYKRVCNGRVKLRQTALSVIDVNDLCAKRWLLRLSSFMSPLLIYVDFLRDASCLGWRVRFFDECVSESSRFLVTGEHMVVLMFSCPTVDRLVTTSPCLLSIYMLGGLTWHTYTAYLSMPWPYPIFSFIYFLFFYVTYDIFCFVHATGGL